MEQIRIVLSAVATVCVSVALFTDSARAENGQIAAGILDGLAVGTILGAATAPRPFAVYPVYVEPSPVYVERDCYWTRGQPVWDGWRGAWVRPRVRVCD